MTNLSRLNVFVPTLYRALNTVGRELAGATMAVTRSSNAEAVAIGQKIMFPTSNAMTSKNVTPAMNVPEGEAGTLQGRQLEITKAKSNTVTWTGNEQVALGNMYDAVLQDQMTEAMRGLVNEIEKDIVATALAEGEAKANAIGASGTVPFATNLNDLTNAYKKLQDKGASTSNLQAVFNTSASMNLRNLTQLQKVNDAGDNTLLRQGVLGKLFGFNIYESAGFTTHTKGTGTGYLVNGAAKKGDTTINIDTGEGTILAGDMVTFKGTETGAVASRKYVVAQDMANAKLKLITPLDADIGDNSTIAVCDNYLANLVFPKNAIWLMTRTVPDPVGGDKAIAKRTITDPLTGLSFGVSLYPGYKQNQIEVSIAWGVGIIKPEFIVPILG